MTLEDLLKYKGSVSDDINAEANMFSKNFLLVAGGLLAFSITFIKEIITLNTAAYLWLLYCSWGLIIISIAMIIYTTLYSTNLSGRMVLEINDYCDKNDINDDDQKVDKEGKLIPIVIPKEHALAIRENNRKLLNRSKIVLKRLRAWAARFFCTGLIFLFGFITINISNNKQTKEKQVVPKDVNIKINGVDILQTDSTLILTY